MHIARNGLAIIQWLDGSTGNIRRNASKRLALYSGTWSAVAIGVAVGMNPSAAQQPPSSSRPQISKIVVTAERREATVQESSLAIQVLSDEDIQRSEVRAVQDLNFYVPGLVVGGGGGNATQIYMRGVGDFAVGALSNPAVGVNIDDVYVARPEAVNTGFYDLARIEVLKGPQGTFYGRNTSGGAINLITTAPSLERSGGFLSVGGGNLGNYSVEGALNVPMGDMFAARGAFLVVKHDGYLSDGTDDADSKSGRLRLLFQPSEYFSTVFSADYTQEGGKGPGYVLHPRVTTNAWESSSSPTSNAVLAAAQPFTPFPVPPVGTDNFRDNRFANVSAESNWNFGPVTLTVIPAYRDAKYSEINYPAGLRNYIPDGKSQETTIEARLANNHARRLKWVAGLYYFDENQGVQQQISEGLLQENIGFYNSVVGSHAAFGQATFSITNALRLIGGLRYTDERVSVSGNLNTISPVVSIPFTCDRTVKLVGGQPQLNTPCDVTDFGGAKNFAETTWRAGAEYDVSPSSMLYATASTGFKAGGFNQAVAPLDTYKPENVTAYEIGSRNQFWNKRIQANFEAFDWEYSDYQVNHVVFDPLGNINIVNTNAGSATIRGGNVDIEALLGFRDRVRLMTEYNKTDFESFSFLTSFSETIPFVSPFPTPTFNPLSTGCKVGPNPIPGNAFPDRGISATQLISINCSGFPLPRAPEWSGAASYDHTLSLGSGELDAMGSVYFAASRYLNFDFVQAEKAPSYVTLNFDLTYTAPNRRWQLAGYVHNALNENVYVGAQEQPLAPPVTYATIAPPRVYGVRLRYNLD
jgi:iron complex outermembrane receptor protein